MARTDHTPGAVPGRAVVLVLVLAAAVRLGYTLELRAFPTFRYLVMDAQAYDGLARAMAAGGWLPERAFYQAPLYPYFLAAIYALVAPSLTAVRVVQVLLGSLTASLLAVVGRPLVGARASLVAGVMAALYAPLVFYTPQLLKPTLLLFLEVVLLGLLAHGARRGLAVSWAAAGVACGLSVLLRGNLLLLVPLVLLWLAWARRGDGPARVVGRAALPFTAALALTLLPVTLINRAVSGAWVLTSSQGGMNFYIGNRAGATGTYDGLSAGSQSPEHQRRDADALAARLLAAERGVEVDPATLSPAAVSRVFWRQAGREIAADPRAWLRLMGRKMRLYWNAYEIPDAESFYVYRASSAVLRASVFGFGVVAPLGLLGLGLLARSRPPAAALLAVLVAASCFSVVPFFVFGRYRLPVVVFLLLPAAYAVTALAEAVRRGERKRLVPAAGALALLALFVNLPALTPSAAEALSTHFNLSSAGLRAAADRYQQFLAARGGGEAALLGEALALTEEAIGRLHRVLDTDPAFFAAYPQLASALHRRGHYLGHFGRADAAFDSYRRAAETLDAGLRLHPSRRPDAMAARAAAMVEVIEGNAARAFAGWRERLRALDQAALDAAVAAYDTALAREPESAWLQAQRAWLDVERARRLAATDAPAAAAAEAAARARWQRLQAADAARWQWGPEAIGRALDGEP